MLDLQNEQPFISTEYVMHVMFYIVLAPTLYTFLMKKKTLLYNKYQKRMFVISENSDISIEDYLIKVEKWIQ